MTLPIMLFSPDQVLSSSLVKGGLVLFTYLLASVPFGYLFVRWSQHLDLRTIGSYNIGATNAFRAGGMLVGLGTLAADVGKGAFPVWMSGWFFAEEPLWRAICAGTAVLGHCFPLYFAFRGGKGVATGFGALFPLIPKSVFMALPFLGLLLVTSRIMALSTLSAMLSLPFLTLYFYPDSPLFFITSLGIGSFVLIRHRSNILRLWKGTEREFGDARESTKPVSNTRDNPLGEKR